MLGLGTNGVLYCLVALVGPTAIAQAATTTPRPTALSVPVRTEWHGLDGNWSPVSLRLGSSPQWINVFVSTAGQETLVVGPAGCDVTDTQCPAARGGLFDASQSKTWQNQGAFDLGLDPQLGFDGDAVYGLDDIAFNDQISVPSQIVGVVNTTEYFLGFFGLGVQPTNFTSVNQPTFLDSIVENKSLVPSHSYGYTAGAYYRKCRVLYFFEDRQLIYSRPQAHPFIIDIGWR